MKKNVFGFLGLLGALLLASCTNPMIASGSSDEPEAPTPVVAVVAHPDTYCVGESALLSATVTNSGNGSVAYQWYKVTGTGDEAESIAIPGAVSSTYISKEERAGDYVYFVKVSNTLGKSIKIVESDSITIKVSPAPVAEASIPSITLTKNKEFYAKGGRVTLVATARTTDEGDLTYKWFCDGTEIPGAIDSTYIWENADAGEFTFKVEVTNTLNETTKKADASIVVLVLEEEAVNAETPVFKYSLVGKTYKLGSNEGDVEEFDATAEVSDGGKLVYQWYIVKAERDVKIDKAGSAKFTPSIKELGDTTYKVVVTNYNLNASGEHTASASKSVVISVVDPTKENASVPVITSQPVSAEYTIGDTLVTPLSVIANGDGNLSYQWYKATSADGEGSVIPSATNETYTPEIAAIGSIWYYCIVTNTAEAAERDKTATKKSSYAKISVTEFVAKVPSVSISPATVSVKSGDSVTLTASVSGQDEGAVLTYQWKKDGEAIKDETSATYTFSAPSVTEETNFTYTCEVTSTVTKYNATATATGTKTVNVTVAPATGSISIDFN